jgi:hypothetical protein
MSITATMTSMTASPSHNVKMKFFDSIGIDSRSTLPKEAAKETALLNTDWVHPRSQGVATFQERLKYDPKADRMFAPKRGDKEPISKRTKRKKKSLSFDEQVEVVPIPMRTEYSNRVRSRLWSSAIEIQENAARNTIEFASEGYVDRALYCVLLFSFLCSHKMLRLFQTCRWNWKNVLEDDRMYVCVATSELIHPCHYERDFRHGFR